MKIAFFYREKLRKRMTLDLLYFALFSNPKKCPFLPPFFPPIKEYLSCSIHLI